MFGLPGQVLQDAQSTDSGIVTLGASQTVATYLIPPLIAPFRQANPQVRSAADRTLPDACHSSSALSLQLKSDRRGSEDMLHTCGLDTPSLKETGRPAQD